jgi:hypothetical protein
MHENRYARCNKSKLYLACGRKLLSFPRRCDIKHAGPQKSEICVDLGSGRGADVMRMAD